MAAAPFIRTEFFSLTNFSFNRGLASGYAGSVPVQCSLPSPLSLRFSAARIFVVSILLSSSAAAGAAPALFHSPGDDGVESLTTPVLPGSPAEILYLYLDAGPASSAGGTPCVDGDGDEVCAWEFELLTSGAVAIQGFTPDPGRDVVWKADSASLRATGGDARSGEMGPLRLGEVDLNVMGTDWSVGVGAGSAVDAGFMLVEISGGVIAVPEPERLPLWLAGVGMLWLLLRRHSTRILSARLIAAALWVVLLVSPIFMAAPAMAQDADLDGIPDLSDNCVYVPNAGQEDAGGLHGPPADGIGDACQCGDLNSDGQVDLLDAATYQRDLAGLLPEADDPDRCSVIGGRLDCEPNDEWTLREALVGIEPGVSQVCEAAVGTPTAPSRMAAAGDSITQAFAANCTCNAGLLGLFCLLCTAGGDQPQHSWFDGGSLGGSFRDQYGTGSGISSARVSVSGAEMLGGADSFASQADDLLALIPLPELVVVELGGNDVCNRDCVDPSHCADPLYTEAEWIQAVAAGLDKLVGFNHPTSLSSGATIYLLGVPRVQELRAAGVALQESSGSINCDSFWDTFNVCEIATLDVTVNGENLSTRLAAIEARIPEYNAALRDLALAYSTNENGRNPLGIEVVSDYVNESTPSTGTTSFGAGELNGGDCFHPNLQGQRLIATEAWIGNPRKPAAP